MACKESPAGSNNNNNNNKKKKKKKDDNDPDTRQTDIMSFFQRQLQFSKSLSERTAIRVTSPAAVAEASPPSLNTTKGKSNNDNVENQSNSRKKRKADLVEIEAGSPLATTSSPSSGMQPQPAQPKGSIDGENEGVWAEDAGTKALNQVTKRRRVHGHNEEEREEEEDGEEDTEEDEDIRLEYEEKKLTVRTTPEGEEEENRLQARSPSLLRPSPPGVRRLVHANTVTDLKELKRRSPSSVAKSLTLGHTHNRDQACRREEESKNNGDPIDRSGTRLWKEVRTPQGHTIQIRHGDITTEVVGAVVNAANSHLAHGGGVAGAIVRAGGRMIQVESDKWVRQHGEVATGNVAVTGPGRMGCEFIIHAVGPICFNKDSMAKKDRELASAVENSLLKAEELGLRSISLPAISSGIFGFPKVRCAEIMFTTTLSFCRNHPDSTLRQIRFTNWDTETVSIFEEEFDKRFGSE